MILRSPVAALAIFAFDVDQATKPTALAQPAQAVPLLSFPASTLCSALMRGQLRNAVGGHVCVSAL